MYFVVVVVTIKLNCLMWTPMLVMFSCWNSCSVSRTNLSHVVVFVIDEYFVFLFTLRSIAVFMVMMTGKWSEGSCCTVLHVVVVRSDGEQNVVSGNELL